MATANTKRAASSAQSSSLLLLDRLVSASSGADVLRSLQEMWHALHDHTLTVADVDNHDEMMAALLSIAQSNEYLHMAMDENNEGRVLVLRILGQLVAASSSLSVLQLPSTASDGAWMQCLVDIACPDDEGGGGGGGGGGSNNDNVMSSSSSLPSYVRVLALQIIQQAAARWPKIAQAQLLATPNGLHRLADLLQTPDESVRNQALLLAHQLASWPSVARLWIFAEVGDVLCRVMLSEGGLRGGNVIVLDCLHILQALLQHDAQLCELVCQSRFVLTTFIRLLDLRQGEAFINPTTAMIPSAAVPSPSGPVGETTTGNDDDDGLDALLQGGPPKAAPTPEDAAAATNAAPSPSSRRPVPRLLLAEEDILQALLDILALVLSNDGVQVTITAQHPNLVAMIWELGLLLPPPVQAPYNCAVPSAALQQHALELMAAYLPVETRLHEQYGLERLNVLICTGGGDLTHAGLAARLGLSQAALHVVRQTLSPAAASELLLTTLAPPMMDSANDTDTMALSGHGGGGGPTVVQKLLNTLWENVNSAVAGDDNNTQLFLSGAAGVLAGAFLRDEASRSILLRLTHGNHPGAADAAGPDSAPSSLLEAVLDALQAWGDRDGDKNDFGPIVLLRFLCHWTYEAPMVAHAVLSCPSSTVLSQLVAVSNKKQPLVATLALLLLGLLGDAVTDETQCGGWTRAAIFDLVQQRQRNFTAQLTALYQAKHLPWSYCQPEQKVWHDFCHAALLTIRRRIVAELTTTTTRDDDDDDANPPTNESADDGGLPDETAARSKKQLQLLVSQQTDELDSLRDTLARAEQTVSIQSKELENWKKRVESNPTQLDEMLTDYTTRNSELEAKVVQLQEELQRQSESHEVALQDRKNDLDRLQSDIVDWRSREAEAREERDSLREDMTALSQAYTNLEEEYRQVSHSTREVSATAAPTGEQQDAARQQPEGEVSEQAPRGGSTELATLRAENSRLREEASAADNWMAMAVERMTAMDAQYRESQLEIESLRQQLGIADANSSLSDVERHLMEERERHETSKAEHAQAIMELEQALYDERMQHDALMAQMHEEKASDSAQSASAALDEMEETKQRLYESREAIAALTAEKTALEERLAGIQSRGGTVERVNAFNVHPSSNVDNVSDEQRQSATAECQKSHKSAAAMDPGMDSLLAELTKKDEEIEELRSSNAAAYEWMDKAVAHSQSLQDRITSLERDNADLGTEMETLRNVGTSGAETEELKVEIDEQKRQLEHYLQSLEESRAQIRTLEDERSAGVVRVAQIEQEIARAIADRKSAETAICELHDQLASTVGHDATVHDLQQQIAALTDDLAQKAIMEQRIGELENVVANLQEQMNEQEREASEVLQELQEEYAAIERELALERTHRETNEVGKNITTGLREETERLQTEIGKLQAELDDARSTAVARGEGVDNDRDLRISALDAIVVDLRNQLEKSEKNASEVVREWQTSYAELEQSLVPAEAHLGRDIARSESVERVQSLEAIITNMRQELAAAQDDAIEAVREWQTTCEDLERRLAEFEAQKGHGFQASADTDISDSELLELRNEKMDLMQQSSAAIAEWQTKYEDLEERLNSELERAHANSDALRVQISELTVAGERQNIELQNAEKELHAWKEQYAELDQRGRLASDETSHNSRVMNDRIQQLEAESAGLRQELASAQVAASKTMQKFQDEIAQLEQSLQDAATVSAANEVDDRDAGRIIELEAQVSNLQDQLDDAEADAAATVQEWMASHAELETTLKEAEARLADNQTQSDAGDIRGIRTGELETHIEELQQALEIVQSASKRWQSLHAEKEHDLLVAETKIQNKDRDIAKHAVRIENVEQELQDAKRQIEKVDSDAAETVRQWQESHEELQAALDAAESETIPELETVIEELRQELRSMRAEGASAIEEWQVSHSELLRDLETAKADLSSAEDSKRELGEKLLQVEALAAQKDNEAQACVREWRESHTEIEARLLDAETKIESLEAAYDRLNEERDEIDSALRENLASSEELRRAVLGFFGLQDTTTTGKLVRALEDESVQKTERESRLMALVEMKAALEEHRDKTLDDMRDRLASAEADNERLQSIAEDFVALRKQHTQLKIELSNVQQLLEVANKDLCAADEIKVHHTAEQEELTHLRSSLNETKQQLTAVEEVRDREQGDAEQAVREWQEAYDDLEQRAHGLEDDLSRLQDIAREADSAREALVEERALRKLLEDDLRQLRTERDDLLRRSDNARRELETIMVESEDAILQWKSRVDELEDEIEALRNDRPQQVSEKDGTLSTGQPASGQPDLALHIYEDYVHVTKRGDDQSSDASMPGPIADGAFEATARRKETEALLQAKLDAERRASQLLDKVKKLEADLKKATETIESTSLNDPSSSGGDGDGVNVQNEVNRLKSEKACLEQETHELLLRIQELEMEVEDATDAIQIHYTNEVTGKAIHTAADALKHQLHELNARMDADQQRFHDERTSRLAAEREANRLRDDLAVVLGMDNTSDNHAEIQRRAMEAAEHFERSERTEIESIKQALSRALDELESARASEQDAHERLAKANVLVTFYEEELVNAKTDLDFSTRTLEELRAGEAERRSALEYRLTSTEKDQGVLRRFHSAEMEKLRNDLDQVIMERDRFFQALKESERQREAMVDASQLDNQSLGGDGPANGESNLRVELLRLRLERAHLLSSIADEGAQAEKRLREAVAAEKASNEADGILERELRMAAEKALLNVRAEMVELRIELAEAKNGQSEQDSTPRHRMLEERLQQLQNKAEQLQSKNHQLKLDLEQSADDSKAEIRRLEQDCLATKARVAKFEEEGRREAEVRVEVSRLQAQQEQLDEEDADDEHGFGRSRRRPHYNVFRPENAAGDGYILTEQDILYAAKLYDEIQQQKTALDEERAMYVEHLHEHETLVSYLAQLSIEKQSLHHALHEHAGDAAVQDALQQAEATVRERFGEYIVA